MHAVDTEGDLQRSVGDNLQTDVGSTSEEHGFSYEVMSGESEDEGVTATGDLSPPR